MEIFTELAIILSITTFITIIARLLSQPLIVGYVLSGILIGPFALNLIGNTEYLHLFSQIGIAILLFIVGLNLNPEAIRENGKTSLITGLGQIIITTICGYLILSLIGWDKVSAIYGAVAMTFSSTIIVLKQLSDRGDMGKLYGKLSIGFLLIQDIVAALLLAFVPLLGIYLSGGDSFTKVFSLLAVKGILSAFLLYLIAKNILPKLSDYLAKSQELLFLFSITWGLLLAGLFYKIGFSIEIGALIAGITLSASNYATEISSKMKPLRDFFVVIFFLLLGSQISFSNIGNILPITIILSIFVLIGNPIIVFIIMNLLKYKRRVSYMCGLATAQISEFSLILLALGLNYSHINKEVVSIITLVAVITIAISSYMMIYADYIYNKIQWLLQWLEILELDNKEKIESENIHNAVIFGYGRVGYEFVRTIRDKGLSYIVVDYNPDTVKNMRGKGVNFIYGDAEDVELLEEIGIHKSNIILSTIPDFNININIVKEYRRKNKDDHIIVFGQSIREAEELYIAGASYVIIPHYLGAYHISEILENSKDGKYDFEIIKTKQKILFQNRG